jgi:hypothetical protein
MWSIRAFAVVAAVLMLAAPATDSAHADELTPKVDDFLETRNYTHAATREILYQWRYAGTEIEAFPAIPTAKEMKDTEMRKRVLDLRLMMDFNTFAYKPNDLLKYRDMLDLVYENVGAYKSLFDTQQIDGFPVDQAEKDKRWNNMINAVGPFRQADVRSKFEKAIDKYESNIYMHDYDDWPRIWQIAGFPPDDSLDSLGNAARLSQAILLNLRAQGLTIGDPLDPEQEAHFHDIRKAMRSVVTLIDMFPSSNAAVAGVRGPIDDVVDAYGKANDQFVAYHEAQYFGRPLEPRVAGVQKAFNKAQDLANEFAWGGQMDAYVAVLSQVQSSHTR